MSNAVIDRQKNCCQEFWYILPDVEIQLEQSYNDNPACKKNLVQGCQASTCGLLLVRALVQVLQNSGSLMVVLRFTTLPALDCH